MKTTLAALFASTIISHGAIISTFDDPRTLLGAKFTITYEDESIIQVPSGNVVGHAGLKVTIKAEGTSDVHLQQVKLVNFDNYEIQREGIIWSTGSDFVFSGETVDRFNVYREINFWQPIEWVPFNTSDYLIFKDGDELTLFYPGVKESDVNIYNQMITVGGPSTPDGHNSYTRVVFPDRTETIPEPSAALLTLLAALGTLRPKR